MLMYISIDWKETQPDVNDNSCLTLKTDGQWYDELCSTEQKFVAACVKEKQDVATPGKC